MKSKGMSWPALWLVVIVVVVAGYFVGQGLNLDHPTQAAAVATQH